MSIALPYPNMSFTPLDVLTAEEMNQIVANYTYIANNASGGGGGGGASILDCYPVGSYYETSDTSFNPNVSWGGTWILDSQGRVTVAQDSGTFARVGSTGGSKDTTHTHDTGDHTLTENEIPGHNHQIGFWGASAPVEEVHVGSRAVSVASLPTGDAHLLFQYVQESGGIINNVYHTQYAPAYGGSAHNHGPTAEATVSTVQPYVVVRRWHRTA